MRRAATTVAMFAAVALSGCQRAPTQSPELGNGAALSDPQTRSGASDEGWTEADEISGKEMEAPVEVADVAAEPVEGVPTEHVTFNDLDPVPGPTEMVLPQPERPPNASLLSEGMLRGPK